MVYANADLTKAEQAAEIIAFADYWNTATGTDPGLLVFDSQLTTYKILDQLTARGINWLTLRQRGKNQLARLAALPASAWKTVTIARSGRYRRPRLHEDMVKLTDVSAKVRQIAVKNIGRDEPTLLITHDLVTPARDLFARYAERMTVENELDAYIGGFHLDALTCGVPLNVDLDTTLTVVAGNLYRLLALNLAQIRKRHPRQDLAALPGRHRHPAHHRQRRHLRAEPAQPPPRPHRRRLRRPGSSHPLVGRAHPAVPLPATMIPTGGTSTQLPDRESRLAGHAAGFVNRHASTRPACRAGRPKSPVR